MNASATLPHVTSAAGAHPSSDDVVARTGLRERIVHVPRRFVSEEWGGTETVVLEIAKRQQASGYDPMVVTSLALATREREVIHGVPVRRHRYTYPFFGLSSLEKLALDKKGGNMLSLSLLYALLTIPHVRLYHAHTLKRVGGIVCTAARLRRKPSVVSVHGGIFDVPAAEQELLLQPICGKLEWGRPFGALLGSRTVLEDADMVIFVSQPEAEVARRHLKHDRIAHLPNGVDYARFSRGHGAAFRAQLGIRQDAFLALNVARIDEQKNQGLLLESFAQLAARHADAHLVLLGPETQPTYATRLKERIAQADLAGRVHMMPAMRHDAPALVDAFHACDALVLPSRHEPFGIAVLEAWSAGKPVITSAVGGLAALVRDGETGLCFNPAAADAEEQLTEKLLLLARHEVLRGDLATAGQREAQTLYDWSRIAARQEEIYQLAERHHSARRRRRTS